MNRKFALPYEYFIETGEIHATHTPRPDGGSGSRRMQDVRENDGVDTRTVECSVWARRLASLPELAYNLHYRLRRPVAGMNPTPSRRYRTSHPAASINRSRKSMGTKLVDGQCYDGKLVPAL
jgi:hypothetical protein